MLLNELRHETLGVCERLGQFWQMQEIETIQIVQSSILALVQSQLKTSAQSMTFDPHRLVSGQAQMLINELPLLVQPLVAEQVQTLINELPLLVQSLATGQISGQVQTLINELPLLVQSLKITIT